MKRLLFLLTISIGFLPTLCAMNTALALTDAEIKARTHIINLEAQPRWFRPGEPIDFIVTVKYDGGTQNGFDVAVFHERRLVGVERNQRFRGGVNTFKVRDRAFEGDPGDYIVKLRFKNDWFATKRFATTPRCEYTINPSERIRVRPAVPR